MTTSTIDKKKFCLLFVLFFHHLHQLHASSRPPLFSLFRGRGLSSVEASSGSAHGSGGSHGGGGESHGGNGDGNGNGNSDQIPGHGAIIPLYAAGAGAHHNNKQHHHGKNNATVNTIGLMSLVGRGRIMQSNRKAQKRTKYLSHLTIAWNIKRRRQWCWKSKTRQEG
ncbi:hypothetical protein NMG60_11015570 [Bertholletia excelsa]